MKEYLLLLLVLHTSAAPLGSDDVAECHDVPKMCLISPSYTKMRLPNMFNDTRAKDVERTLEAWKPLLNSTTCNAGNQFKYFLCFSYAPVCVHKLISPCKSLCETVRDACDPVLRQYNHSWPSYFDCDQPRKFQDDSSQMCINLQMIGITRTRNDVPLCSCKHRYKNQALRSQLCKSDFVFSAWVTKHDKRTNQIEVNVSRKFRMLKAFPNAGTLTLDLSVTKKNCRCNKLLGKKKARRFLILASSEGGSLKVKAMKKMEKKQEIEKMAKQC